MARVTDGQSAENDHVQDSFMPSRSSRASAMRDALSGRLGGKPRMLPGYMTPKASVTRSGRSIVHSTRSMPGFVSQFLAEASGADTAKGSDPWLQAQAVLQQAQAARSARLPTGAVVPLSAIPAGRVKAHMHDRAWEIKLRNRHENRLAGGYFSPAERRAHASQRRRQWASSSRRWLEERASAPPRTKQERAQSRQRLYAVSARRQAAPRVYA